MTSLDPGSVSILTAAAPDAAVLTEALHFAVRRDLARLAQVLAAPVTAVRRAALVDHTCFVLDELQTNHQTLDVLTNGEVAGPIADVRNASLRWRADPELRLEVLSAVRELRAALSPVLDQISAVASVIDDGPGSESRSARPPTAAWFAAPTRVARRTFWLLDELEPRHASSLTARTPLAVMWILRNGFSGAYNRSAYLMWVGGGTGPAV